MHVKYIEQVKTHPIFWKTWAVELGVDKKNILKANGIKVY